MKHVCFSRTSPLIRKTPIGFGIKNRYAPGNEKYLERTVGKYAIKLVLLFLISPLFAGTPGVTLKTTSLGYPYTTAFQVNILFSEAVVGFGPAQVNITNGTIQSFSGSQASYSIQVLANQPGNISMLVPAYEVTSVSTGEPNLVSNTLNIMSLNPNVRPSSNFNLTQWNLTLPLPLGGGKSEAISIGTPTLNGNPANNTGYSILPYFGTELTTGAMVFFAPLNGATTPNSNFPRCELLEALPGSPPTWTLKQFASNTLTASLLVSQVPPSKRVVIGQIHDTGTTDIYGHNASNSPLLKVYYDMNALDPNQHACNGCVYGQVRVVPAYGNFLRIVNLLNNIPLNQLFKYQISLLRDGTLTIKANDTATIVKLGTSTNNTMGWGAQNLYFKAGMYVQDEGKSNILGGTAKFYSLQVKHS